MLFHTTATKYWYTRNAQTNISTYGSTWTSFKCNIQPLSTNEWVAMGLEGWAMYNKYRIYTRESLTVWEKISALWETFVIDSVAVWNGLRDKYFKIIATKSNGV